MKSVSFIALLLGSLASAAFAEGVTPRYADTLQSRKAEAVQPRYAPSVLPRQADAVPPRSAPEARNTAVQGNRPSEWHWQKIGDTGVAGDGVARGSQLKNIRCAGVACRVFQDSAGAWTVRAEGGFPAASGRTLDVVTMNIQTRQSLGDSRSRGVFSDGGFWDQVETWRLPVGSYATFYKWSDQNQVLAVITFDVLKNPASEGGGANSNAKSEAYSRQRARDIALQNQRCLAMAATNPDVRCVPQ